MTEQPTATFDPANPNHHVIAAKPSTYGEIDAWHSVNNTEIRMYAKYVRGIVNFTVGAYGADGEARHEHGGPVVKGQYGYLVPQATVISAHPQRRPWVIEMSQGDMLNVFCLDAAGDPVQSLLFKVLDDHPMDYPQLIPAGITRY